MSRPGDTLGSPPIFAYKAAERTGDVIHVGYYDAITPFAAEQEEVRYSYPLPVRFIAGEPIPKHTRVVFGPDGRVYRA